MSGEESGLPAWAYVVGYVLLNTAIQNEKYYNPEFDRIHWLEKDR